MFNKREIKRQIAASENEIEELEKKRVRSQCAIMEANINKVDPSDYDLEYFKIYSNLIELERKNLRQLRAELDKHGKRHKAAKGKPEKQPAKADEADKEEKSKESGALNDNPPNETAADEIKSEDKQSDKKIDKKEKKEKKEKKVKKEKAQKDGKKEATND